MGLNWAAADARAPRYDYMQPLCMHALMMHEADSEASSHSQEDDNDKEGNSAASKPLKMAVLKPPGAGSKIGKVSGQHAPLGTESRTTGPRKDHWASIMLGGEGPGGVALRSTIASASRENSCGSREGRALYRIPAGQARAFKM